jgi:hypothetical protein
MTGENTANNFLAAIWRDRLAAHAPMLQALAIILALICVGVGALFVVTQIPRAPVWALAPIAVMVGLLQFTSVCALIAHTNTKGRLTSGFLPWQAWVLNVAWLVGVGVLFIQRYAAIQNAEPGVDFPPGSVDLLLGFLSYFFYFHTMIYSGAIRVARADT